jgi:hypothetical protein
MFKLNNFSSKKISTIISIITLVLIIITIIGFKITYYDNKKINLKNTVIDNEKLLLTKFYLAGHVYGAPSEKNNGLHKPFVDFMTKNDSINKFDFGMLLGDLTYIPNKETYTEIETFIKNTGVKHYAAIGNHDETLSAKYFKKLFGQKTFYSFSKNDSLFIVLDPGKDWAIGYDQILFLKETLKKSNMYQNIFVFTHQLFWVEKDNIFSVIKPNSFAGKENHSNFWTEVVPLLENYNGQVYFCAGDVGAFDNNSSIVYEKIDNYHFIATGMGGGNDDNIIITSIYENGEVEFDIVTLNGNNINRLGKLEDYKKSEVKSIDEFN